MQKLGTSDVLQVAEQQNAQPKPDMAARTMKLQAIKAKRVAEHSDVNDFVYFSRLSPLCRSLCTCCYVYLIMIAITAILLAVNIKSCGMDARQHIMRMRNITGPVTFPGITGYVDQT